MQMFFLAALQLFILKFFRRLQLSVPHWPTDGTRYMHISGGKSCGQSFRELSSYLSLLLVIQQYVRYCRAV